MLLLLAFGRGQGSAFTEGARLLEEARMSFDSANYQRALARGQRALTLLNEQGPERATCLELIGDAFLETGQLAAAEQQYNEALSILTEKTGPQSVAVAGTLNRLGEYRYRKSEYKKAANYFRKALIIREKALGKVHELVADSYNNLGNCQVGEGHYAAATRLHRKALLIRQRTLPAEHPDMATSYNNLGNCAYLSADYDTAVSCFKKALSIREKILGAGHPKTAQVLNNLGNACAKLGLNHEAQRHYQRALQIRRQTLGDRHPGVAGILENLADLNIDGGDFIAALDLYRQAYGIQCEIQGDSSPAAALLWHNIGLCYQYEGDYDRALAHHVTAEKILMPAFGPRHPQVAALYNNIGNCYSGKKEPEQALVYYRKALIAFETAQPFPATLIAEVYKNIGNVYLEMHKPADALAAFKKAFKMLGGGNADASEKADCLKSQGLALESMGFWPEARVVFESAMEYAKNAAGTTRNSVQDAWGSVLARRGIRFSDSILLRQSVSVLAESRRRSDSLQCILSAPAARQRWIELRFPALASEMEATFAWWKITGERALLEQAFTLAERNKSMQLLEQIRHEQAETSSGIPDSLLQRERYLLDLINRREKELLAWQQSGRQAEMRAGSMGLAETRQSLNELRQYFERQYPAYYKLKYDVSTVSLPLIQTRLLQGNMAMLEYFVTDSAIFAFVVKPESIHCQRLPLNPSIDDQIAGLRHALQSYPDAAGEMAGSMARDYTELAYQLFETLFAPIEKTVALPERLVIVPDGTLAYLPFECLLRQRPLDPQQFKSHPYLIRDYSISYANSAWQQWLLTQKQPSVPTENLLAVAPVYGRNRYGLGALQHNLQEAGAVREILGGKVMAGSAASVSAFRKEACRYRVLLLSMHGKASSRVGDLSYLAFSTFPDTSENPFLYARDLYTQSIPANLVVLSACETSVGSYRFGQGVISLAKGFFQAGARSVAATLWSVDDARNAELVRLFFRHLKNGELKDDALRSAKMEYLEQHPHDEANPVYWAALTVYGDMRPLDCTGHSHVIWALGLLLLALFSLFYWKRLK